MHNVKQLFTPDDVEKARDAISSGPPKLQNALRFQASLRALLMDARRSQRDGRNQAVFAIDPVEVVNLIEPSRSPFSAFTFYDLLNPERNKSLEQSLHELDKIVSFNLMVRDSAQFLLVDSYCDELIEARQARLRDIDTTEDFIIGNTDLAKRPFEGFSLGQINNIRDNILKQGTAAKSKVEAEIFFKTFLPHWRADLYSSLENKRRRLRSLDEFMSNANYSFIRGDSFGRRAISHLIPKFSWNKFEAFLEDPRVVSEADEITEVVHDLASGVERFGRSGPRNSRAAMHDAIAISDLHVLNSFLEAEGHETRAELVTRSSLLADLLRSLPSGKIKLQIRHPLLLPEAFSFESNAVDAIADISQRFDAVITPYLEHSASSALLEPEGNSAASPELTRYLHEASKVAQELVHWLVDSCMIQAGVSITKDEFTRAYINTLPPDRRSREDQELGQLVDQIRGLFELITRNLGRSSVPLTHQALISLIKQNQTLAETVWERAFPNGDSIRIRALTISEGSSISEVPCIAFRCVSSSFTRLFHLHSTKVRETIRALGLDTNGRANEFQPVEVALSSDETIKTLGKLLEDLTQAALKGRSPREDEMVRTIDATLLVGVALASRGEVNASISLASTVLHHLMELRRDSFATKETIQTGVKLSLAWRELMLFRHFAERLAGIDEFLLQERIATSTYLRGSLERNYARAQRDLDVAAEYGWVGERGTASRLLNDIRLRLVHMSGWLEMFLMSSRLNLLEIQDSKSRALVRLSIRKDIWSGVGYVKEALDDIERVRLAYKNLDEGSVSSIESRRYFAQIEARLYQTILAAFLGLTFSRGTPMARRLFDPTADLNSEQLLKFHRWPEWWERLQLLVSKYEFKFRLPQVIKPVMEMLEEVETLRKTDPDEYSSPRELHAYKSEAAMVSWQKTLLRLEDVKRGSGGFGKLLLDHVVIGLKSEIDRSHTGV